MTSTLNDQLSQLPTMTLAVSQELFKQGDPTDALYIVKRGLLGVSIDDDGQAIEIDRLAVGAIVGELGVLSGRPRTATVYALEDSELTVISTAEHAALSAEFPDFITTLTADSRPRWQRLQLATHLKRLFGNLDADGLQLLQEQLVWRHLPSEEILCRQDESASSMYLIVNGRVQFYIEEDDGSYRSVGQAGRGETIGEFAVLSTGTRSATVAAMRASDVVEMTQQTFEQLALKHPQLVREIARIIVERQQRIYGKKTSPESALAEMTLTLLPATAGDDIRPFADQLAAALSAYGSYLMLDSQRFDDLFGYAGAAQIDAAHPNHPATVRWLNEQERKHDFLLFLPDAEWTNWTQRCIGQSDRALVVGRPSGSPQVNVIERRMRDAYPNLRRELALWHSAETEHPSNTLPWLAVRDVTAHHHVRDGEGRHFGRIARRLTKRAVGLTLSGGGARGFVHLGVFRALEEANIPIDYIGGTSFGALIGVGRSREWRYQEMLAEANKSANNKLLFDRTLPMVALNDSTKMKQMLQSLYHDWQIEDSWIPYFAVATNLSRARMEIFDRGSVWRAVRQSVSIPGVFAPVIVDGDIIVDGAVMNNFPVDLVIERSESERVIGVQCAPSTVKKRHYDFEMDVSGWSLLADRLNPFAKKRRFPTIANTIMRTFDVNSLRLSRQNELLCDLLLQPEPQQFSILDFEAYRDIAALGYDRSVEQVNTWAGQQRDLHPKEVSL